MRKLTRILLTIWLAAFTGLAADEPSSPDRALGTDAAKTEAEATDTTKLAEEPASDQSMEPGSEDARKEEWRPRPETRPLVKLGQNVTLKAGDTAEVVVVVGGSAKVEGRVREAVVVVAGNVEITGEVDGDAVVAVLGSVTAKKGARIRGDVVSVGGGINVEEGAEIKGEVIPVDFGLTDWQVEGLRRWFYQCVIKMRPLAPQVGWVWGVAGVFFLFYLFVAIVFPRPVRACVDELGKRPATSFIMSLLTLLLVPMILAILIATGLGVFVCPFLLAALLLGGIAGKVAIIEWLGLRLAGAFGPDLSSKPVIALFLGTILVSLLYLVPVLGIVIFFVLSIWGLGSAVMATIGSFRREMPERVQPTGGAFGPAGGDLPGGPAYQTAMAGAVPGASAMPNTGPASADWTSGASQAGGPATPGIAGQATPEPGLPNGGPAPFAASSSGIPPLVSPSLPEALCLPKASFWQRMGAGFLDLVLVGILSAIVGGPPLGFLVALAYFAGFWAWKQTTVGGIVVGVKVARIDGQPVTFAVALVRALGGFFSMVVLFLGFLWIAWDPEKQSWHDKIAGTVVLKQPRGTPLVCL